jgi:SAM-dependent methyltransferase
MSENVIRCPLCGASQSSLFDRRKFRGELVTNRICSRCGLVYQSPRPSDQQLASFYESEYRQVYQGSQGPTQKDLATQAGRADALLDFVQLRVRNFARHLDIGCSAGTLLGRFRGHYGCQAIGVEPGKAYRVYARGQGLTIYPSLDAMRAKETEPFDLISLAHVLEHLPDPVAYLARLREAFLMPSGWLLLEVPNLYAHDCFEIAHLVSYSEHTLGQVLQKAGFGLAAVQKHGQPRSKILPLYLTILASPRSELSRFGEDQIQPERFVGMKRDFGMFRRWVMQRFFPRQAWISV